MGATSFGTQLAPWMARCDLGGEAPVAHRVVPVGPLEIHPAAHALHYGSACFEGLKAHRGTDGRVRIFRPDAHVTRLQHSAQLLCLPTPDTALVTAMLRDVVEANLDVVPDAPGALYLRPVLLGTDANIGAAAAPSSGALLYVLASPVGDYFDGGGRALRLLVETSLARTTRQFGRVKSGGNYAMALGPIRRARAEHDADQILFAPDGVVSETGAANFFLLDDQRVVTPPLDDSLLHGVTRDSVLRLGRDLGLDVQERELHVDELLTFAPRAEAALSGTAAVLADVGVLLHDGREVVVGTGRGHGATRRLREALQQVQRGQVEDRYGWTTEV